MRSKKRKEDPRYVVHCGDSQYYFQFGRMYRLSYLEKVFQKELAKRLFDDPTLFPGLVLRDGSGQLWKPDVRVTLVPVEKPEE
jgi:hypothetical protein